MAFKRPPWQQGQFSEADTDPLAGFANIMDVMLVFALGLLVALIAQSQELRQHFRLQEAVDIRQGQELAEPPGSLREQIESGAEGMESLGRVYRDPQTGKLILIKGNAG
ncbi:DUF2149 domain-containing protein [Parahaliea aestuarii]|uniref:DUF2149 domain-containing protein n=1 Tax=Parahaliea aestuarii TaxID=1852021 RepID=A0A5C8ZT69_9GAMM|nr:DUF2149 domain-containing protein [Parahaliea aestuarii]TXS91625.1 DUF2149 domain-containing protein [Parahaliea aestuarii]